MRKIDNKFILFLMNLITSLLSEKGIRKEEMNRIIRRKER